MAARKLLGGLRRRGHLAVAAVIALVATLLVSGVVTAAHADPDPATAGRGRPSPTPTGSPTPPSLSPADGSYIEGTVKVAAVPAAAGDSVTELAVDGAALNATRTVGVSRLRFDVGSNSTEARYHNYVLVNGVYRSDIGDLVNERGTIEIPNEHLVKGENTIEIFAGTIQSSCGTNYDDFVLSDVGLELLGEVADGEDNPYTLSFGDGNCGSNTALLKQATLKFFVKGDPQGTTGLATDLDTTTLANGEHAITAKAASGATVKHTVTVNNAPAGRPGCCPRTARWWHAPRRSTRPCRPPAGAASRPSPSTARNPPRRPPWATVRRRSASTWARTRSTTSTTTSCSSTASASTWEAPGPAGASRSPFPPGSWCRGTTRSRS
ncbi:hypothetical protein [Microbispora sp. GKU 823]|uniref:hypothetical protein n=1 Tax=Microbispora sp. GKU 823 TaxID=1652100 RepID=UPI002119B47E|nr:hypothetical protein [Microbispora sp. GKU 823]